jgi:hypothetical protein
VSLAKYTVLEDSAKIHFLGPEPYRSRDDTQTKQAMEQLLLMQIKHITGVRWAQMLSSLWFQDLFDIEIALASKITLASV